MIFRTLKLIVIIAIACFSLFSTISHANDVNIEQLQATEKQWIAKQSKLISALSSQHLNQQLTGNIQKDLETLQLLLDKKIVAKDDFKMLRAMGVVLANLYIKEVGVQWISYKDSKGRSLGLQWMNSEQIYFPVTKISRIAGANMNVNTKKIYENGLKKIYLAIKENNRQKMSTLK